MRFTLWAAALFAVTSSALAEATAANVQSTSRNALLSYDGGAPLNVREETSRAEGAATIREVRFAGSTPADEQRATVIAPAGAGPFAGVLFVHWLGDPETTNRTEFLKEATGFAARGTVSVLVDAMWAEPNWWDKRVPEGDYARSIQQVVNLRRALDLLVSQPHVDPKRIGYVGHDFGAMYGVIMGAVDHRPKTYVLLAGTPEFADWVVFGKAPASMDAYRAQMRPLDPLRNVSQLAPATVFFQFASRDTYVPKARADAFADAAKEPKLARTYDAEHKMTTPLGTGDRFRWLAKELMLKKE